MFFETFIAIAIIIIAPFLLYVKFYFFYSWICFFSFVNPNKQNVVYTSDTITLPDFPVPFVSTPIVQRTLEKDDSVWFCWLTTKAKASETNPGTILLVRDSTTSSTGTVDFSVSVVAIGRWRDETGEKKGDNTNSGEISQ